MNLITRKALVLTLALLLGLGQVENAQGMQKANISQEQAANSKLFKAAEKKGNVLVCQEALEQGASANVHDKDNWTALHWACQNGDLELAKLLIENGADATIKTKAELHTPLHVAYRAPNYGAFITLLVSAGARVNAKNNDRITPLHLASLTHNLDAMRILIENNANIDTRDSKEQTPLHIACVNYCYCTWAKPMIPEHLVHLAYWPLSRGITLNATDCLEAIRILINHGANINKKDDYDAYPIHYALLYNNLAFVKLLVAHGAHIDSETYEAMVKVMVQHAYIDDAFNMYLQELWHWQEIKEKKQLVAEQRVQYLAGNPEAALSFILAPNFRESILDALEKSDRQNNNQRVLQTIFTVCDTKKTQPGQLLSKHQIDSVKKMLQKRLFGPWNGHISKSPNSATQGILHALLDTQKVDMNFTFA